MMKIIHHACLDRMDHVVLQPNSSAFWFNRGHMYAPQAKQRYQPASHRDGMHATVIYRRGTSKYSICYPVLNFFAMDGRVLDSSSFFHPLYY